MTHKNDIALIAISYAKRLLVSGSREQQRALSYARAIRSYDVIVFTRKRDGFKAPFSLENLTVYPTNSRNSLMLLIDAYRIGRTILRDKQRETCVVSSQDPFESSLIGLLLTRGANAKHHVQLHGDFFGENSWRRESVGNWFRYWFGRLVLSRASCVRVVSARIKQSLIALGIRDTYISVLPIMPGLHSYLSIEQKHANGQENTPLVILAAGRFAREKNFGLIIEALGRLVKQYPNVVLRLVGSGPEEQRLKQLVRTHRLEKNVSFVPWTQSLVEEMRRADIVALSSNHEGYALVLVEAMAAGRPVVTTDVGCAGEMVIDGMHGRIVPVGDVSAYTAALEELLQDGKKRVVYGKQARADIERYAHMSEDEYVKAWVDTLSQCTETV